jgi:hypothetical protein
MHGSAPARARSRNPTHEMREGDRDGNDRFVRCHTCSSATVS